MLVLLLCTLVWQEERASDAARFNRVVSELPARRADITVAELTLLAGKAFLGSPYVGGSLDRQGEESLVVNLERFDCFTLMETCLAVAHAAKADGGYPAFVQSLQRIRYRQGRIEGYPSRLHYTVDWAYDNARKRLVKDVTADLGGALDAKPIHFMTEHRDAYPKLADDEFYEAMRRVEAAINQRERRYIPKDRLASIEDRVQDGDLLALTANVEGLDVVHVGIAIRQNGRLHMLHASTTAKRVEITPQPLAEYLANRARQSGVMIFRPLDR